MLPPCQTPFALALSNIAMTLFDEPHWPFRVVLSLLDLFGATALLSFFFHVTLTNAMDCFAPALRSSKGFFQVLRRMGLMAKQDCGHNYLAIRLGPSLKLQGNSVQSAYRSPKTQKAFYSQ